MSDIQVYATEKEQEFQELAETAENLILSSDEGCVDAVDLHVSCDDMMAQVDSLVLLQNKSYHEAIALNNKSAQTLKDFLLRAKQGFHKAIGIHLSSTGAQRMKSGTATAYFRDNKDKVEMEIDESKLPDKFFKKTPDKTAIKKFIMDNGKAPKGVTYEQSEQEPTLIFKGVE